jgi:hypothetical protein
VYEVPVAAEGTGTAIAQCSRVLQVLRVGGGIFSALAAGYGVGTVINQTFDISGKASDRGARARLLVRESGYSEMTAEVVGVATTLSFLAPDSARAIDQVLGAAGY